MIGPVIKLNEEEVSKCKLFAENVMKQTYNRFNKGEEERKKRIYYGKLGEMIFLKYLLSLDKVPDVTGMFEIYAGESNVDAHDFVTKDGKTIDVKT
ncbi:MAG: hypothetical protein M3004_09795, partial [Bacteroidota bacterium]|nr:hypothetical protein [Bacteroidota bacterium]